VTASTRSEISGTRRLQHGGGFLAFVSLAVWLCGLLAASSDAAAKSITLARGIYWDEGYKYIPQGFTSRADYFKAMGISEVHIWLNDNERDSDNKLPRCNSFTYTDSHGNPRWTKDSLVTFTRELQSAKIKPIYTFSPQVQSDEYIDSLSGSEGPLAIAREEGGIDIELDIEGNWRTDKLLAPCGKGDAGLLTQKLVDAIKGKNEPAGQSGRLQLIVSTTSGMAHWNSELIDAADVLAPQLYDKRYALTQLQIAAEMKTTWLKLAKPIIAALTVECQKNDFTNHKCSETIFDEGLRYVAGLAQCGPSGTHILSYVVWSEAAGLGHSSFGQTYLLKTKNQPIETNCN
jgi:hypothetical protein